MSREERRGNERKRDRDTFEGRRRDDRGDDRRERRNDHQEDDREIKNDHRDDRRGRRNDHRDNGREKQNDHRDKERRNRHGKERSKDRLARKDVSPSDKDKVKEKQVIKEVIDPVTVVDEEEMRNLMGFTSFDTKNAGNYP